MCHVHFPSYQTILSSPTANFNPTGRQYLFPRLHFHCKKVITKIIFRGEAMDPSYPYPLIQIYEERRLTYYTKEKTIELNEIKEMNEFHGIVELIPNEPIRVDHHSALGIYFPNNSTKLSFANGATDSCLYVSSSEPLRYFYFSSATKQRSCIPLLTVETCKIFIHLYLTLTLSFIFCLYFIVSSRPTSSMLTSTSSILTSASSMLTSASSMLTSASSTLMLTSASSMLTSASSTLMLTSASSMLTSTSSTVNSAIITTTSISAFSTMISPSTTPNYKDNGYSLLWIITGGIVAIIIVCGFIIIVYIVVTRRKIIPSSNTVDQLYVLNPFHSADNCMVLNDSYERPPHQYNHLMRYSSIATSHNCNTYQLNPCYGKSNSFSIMNPLPCPPPSPPVCSGTHSYEDPDLLFQIPREYERPITMNKLVVDVFDVK